jgi:hypothetical protein
MNQTTLLNTNDSSEADVLAAKLSDADIPAFQAEFDPDEAERVGAFKEDALTEQDALDSDVDLSSSDLDI